MFGAQLILDPMPNRNHGFIAAVGLRRGAES